MAKHFPWGLERTAKRAEEYARGMLTGGTLFEELGFYYVGPIDGHNLHHLLPVLRNVRDADEAGPILLHVITKKGHGYAPGRGFARQISTACTKFNVITGEQAKAPAGPPSYTKVFADALIAEAERNDQASCAITAAMPSGTGLDRFAKKFPDRCFDVGIAEQHAVTFAAGLATEGLMPFCAIYSTFLQRAYDQVVHDVAHPEPAGALRDRPRRPGRRRWRDARRQLRSVLSRLPARHGADGAERRGGTGAHGGNRRVDRRPALARSAIRAAKAPASRCRRAAKSCRSAGAACCAKAAASRSCASARAWPTRCARPTSWPRAAIPTTVADARFAKPIDTALVEQLARDHEVADYGRGSRRGRFRRRVMHHLAWQGLARWRAALPADGIARPVHRP